jgi:chaperonin cofactor prefoldin
MTSHANQMDELDDEIEAMEVKVITLVEERDKLEARLDEIHAELTAMCGIAEEEDDEEE